MKAIYGAYGEALETQRPCALGEMPSLGGCAIKLDYRVSDRARKYSLITGTPGIEPGTAVSFKELDYDPINFPENELGFGYHKDGKDQFLMGAMSVAWRGQLDMIFIDERQRLFVGCDAYSQTDDPAAADLYHAYTNEAVSCGFNKNGQMLRD